MALQVELGVELEVELEDPSEDKFVAKGVHAYTVCLWIHLQIP